MLFGSLLVKELKCFFHHSSWCVWVSQPQISGAGGFVPGSLNAPCLSRVFNILPWTAAGCCASAAHSVCMNTERGEDRSTGTAGTTGTGRTQRTGRTGPDPGRRTWMDRTAAAASALGRTRRRRSSRSRTGWLWRRRSGCWARAPSS